MGRVLQVLRESPLSGGRVDGGSAKKGALSATFSPGGKRVLTSRIDVSYYSMSTTEDTIVDIWDTENGAEVRDFMGGRALGVLGRR